jgi:hypothetical protein
VLLIVLFPDAIEFDSFVFSAWALCVNASVRPMNTIARTAKFVVPGLLLGTLACGAADSSEPNEPTEQESSDVRKRPKKKPKPPVCAALGEACGAPGPDSACCDPSTRCIEYTVYDYMRCRKPAAPRSYCYRHEQCASNVCNSITGSCD